MPTPEGPIKTEVLWTGPRSLVYVQDTTVDLPRFEVREVELGVRAGDYYVIEEGVEEGEEVVFHGNFRIDSEMQLADRFSMMNREPGGGAIRLHDHGEMEMNDMDTHNHSDVINGATDSFREDFKALLTHYLDGKEALFESDTDAVRPAFQQAASIKAVCNPQDPGQFSDSLLNLLLKSVIMLMTGVLFLLIMPAGYLH